MKNSWIIIFMLFSFYSQAQQQFAIQQKLDRVIEEYVNKHGFNGTILIQQKNKLLHLKSYGLANREFKVANHPQTKYKIASITKLFTSVLIYQLVEKGRLALDKSIKTYLPHYQGEGGSKVTVHQLLTSTSGIAGLEKDGDTVYEKRLTSDKILNKYASGKLVSSAGTKFSYNNADYIVLGKILEAIYQKPFEEILKQQILIPLQMKNTGVFNYKIVDQLANCYWWNKKTNTLERDIPYFVENYYASGAMYSNASDLLTFAQALYDEKTLIQANILEKLLEAKNDVQNKDNYASGLWSYTYKGGENIRHHGAARPGNIWGAEAMLLRLREKKVTIIVLSNSMGKTNMWGFLSKMIGTIYGK